METSRIKKILSQYRELQAEHIIQTSLTLRRTDEEVPPKLKRKIAIIEAWLLLLSDEQWFVVTKHLMDKLPMPLVVAEYEKRWGVKDGKAERTLKRYQSQAIAQIQAFVEKNHYEAQIEMVFPAEESARKRAKTGTSLSLLNRKRVL